MSRKQRRSRFGFGVLGLVLLLPLLLIGVLIWQSVRYRYDTLGSLADIACPVLIMHSAEDEIIPFSHGKALFEAAPEPKHLLVLSGGHNDALLVSRDVYARGVNEFLSGLP